MVKLIIKGTIIGCNEYIRLCRGNKFAASNKVKEIKNNIMWQIKAQTKEIIKNPVKIHYTWIEPNKKRDLDNVAFAKKFISDSLVELGILKNDTWEYVKGFTDDFMIDKDSPRIIIELEEVN